MENKSYPQLTSIPGQSDQRPDQNFRQRAKDMYHKYHHYQDVLFFVCGFCFDLIMVGRIDERFSLIQQAVYLSIIAFVSSLDWYEAFSPFAWRPGFQRAWSYRTPFVHFLLGTLLNFYTIFYFKSASLLTSFGFLGILVLLLFANELPMLKKFGPILRFSLLSLCVISYLTYLVPILLGYIGVGPFILSQALALVFLTGIYFVLKRRLGAHVAGDAKFHPAFKTVMLPSLVVQFVFVLCFVLKILPPVPLSAEYLGIYHQVTKDKNTDTYKLGYTRSKWFFWQNGDQRFEARPGDKIYIFTRLFSPTNFHDQVKVRFEWMTPKGHWEFRDDIPMTITGGREEGFRGLVYKSNYSPGRWRVRLLTSDLREIRRIYFTVVEAEPGEPSEMRFDFH